jgi:hypothetical protein
MLPYYQRYCIEVVINSARYEAVLAAITSLEDSHTLIRLSALEQLGGLEIARKIFLSNLQEDISGTTEQVLEIAIEKSETPYILVFTINDMRSLGTNWSRAYQSGSNSYIAGYSFAPSQEALTSAISLLELFSDELSQQVGRRTTGQLCPISTINKRYTELMECMHDTPKLTPELAEQAIALSERDLRDVVLRARQAKTPTKENIASSLGVPEESIETLLRKAIRSGLLERKLHVYCPGCTQSIATVENEDALSSLISAKVECSKCQRKITKSSFENSYYVTDTGAFLLDGSRWMGIHLRNAIYPFGISDRGRTEVKDGPNELDLVANLDGELLLMELKDSQFSIGHAYPFVGKCSQYHPSVAAIVSTVGIDEDVRGYISNTGLKAEIIENLDSLLPSIENIFSTMNTNRLARFVSHIPWTESLSQAVLLPLGIEVSTENSRWMSSYSGQ